MEDDAGEITRIERQKSGLPRYNIHIDGTYRFSVHEDVLVRLALSKGMRVDGEEIRRILAEEEQNKVRQSAFRYLGYRPRTVREVELHLTAKGYEPDPIRQVITEMKNQGFLDDRRFAEAWVEERRGRKGYGALALKRELERKGISPGIAEDVLSQVDDEEERKLARETAEKRYRRLVGEPWPKVERRLGQYLLRRGFEPPLVYGLLQEFRMRHREEGG